MKDDFFVFDNAIHMYKLTEDNVDFQHGGIERTNALVEYAKKFSGPGYPYDDITGRELAVEDAYRLMFDESDTDIAMAQTVPSHGGWRLGFSPAENNWKLKEAYPLWEALLENGVNNVQFHKGLAFNTQHIKDLAPYDLERAAQDFPDMNFIVHHLGEPFIDETINIAARYENIHLALTAWINQYPVAPRPALHAIGKCLMHVGPDRLLWGSEAFVWPKVQAYIDLFAGMEMPEDLQDGYGYPPLTHEVKAKIFGLNFARLMGIDVDVKLKELYGTGGRKKGKKAKKAARHGK